MNEVDKKILKNMLIGSKDWNTWAQNVYSILEAINDEVRKLDENKCNTTDVTTIKNDLKSLEKNIQEMNLTYSNKIIELQVKSGVWGFVAGVLPAIAVLLLKLL